MIPTLPVSVFTGEHARVGDIDQDRNQRRPVARGFPCSAAPAPRTTVRTSSVTPYLCVLQPGDPRLMSGCRPEGPYLPSGAARLDACHRSAGLSARHRITVACSQLHGTNRVPARSQAHSPETKAAHGSRRVPPVSFAPGKRRLRSVSPPRCGLLHQPACLRPHTPSPGPTEPSHGLKSLGCSSGARTVGRHAIHQY
ncbi:hypothetical protein NDU88_002541 [Pleurodeles waltl]|uniref:Uncharacterized protein n=1 Tax=Pleurodeles waltl TaxID=8319 RepID=A0AAV7T2M8_PLEWA|nr:hypothetical protein NDU88_002541 [Pleurodeles waltl]